MALEFRITFRGDAPGLSDHRLSLIAFAKALDRLGYAFQRTASGMLAGGQMFGRGKIADAARGLDLELTTIEDNCVSLQFTCVDRGPQVPLGEPSLAQRTLARLLDDIKAECSGTEQNPAVRAYVQELPIGVVRQEYKVFKDGQIVSELSCGSAPHVEESDLPRLVQLRGFVVGTGFPPGPITVWLRSGEKTLRFYCERKHVDYCLSLRERPVRAAVLMGPDRIVWVRPDDVPHEKPSIDESIRFAQENWSRTLDILAQ
jgi:hypothetical protein